MNEKIYYRNIPSKDLEPNFTPRPVSTKYFHNWQINNQSIQTINKTKAFDITEVFNPGNARAPSSGYRKNIDHETYLQKKSPGRYLPPQIPEKTRQKTKKQLKILGSFWNNDTSQNIKNNKPI